LDNGMALDTTDLGPAPAAPPTVTTRETSPLTTTGDVIKSTASEWSPRLARWWKRQPIPRWLDGSLRRRILFANIIGLAGLLLTMLYLSLHHSWLVDAKIDVVKTVSRITAEAVAYRAFNDRAVIDPNRLPDNSPLRASRDDAFATMELLIEPQKAAPVLKKLIGPAELTARIYSPTGSLIIDTDTLFADPSTPIVTPPVEESTRLRNTWTRIHYWLINKELKVYRELGTANGFLYPEVKKAAEQGIETPILLLNSKGEQIVTLAEPIKRGSKILGVLVVSTKPGDIDQVLWGERWLILQIATVALLLAIGSSLLLARTVAGPMKRLSEAANHVSQNISARTELPDFTERRDEVGQMGRAFKAMTGALYRRIEASEKFAADVAHELKNPLAAARSTAEALTYAKTEEDRAVLVGEIQSELKRLNRLINDVSNASRLDAELARQSMAFVDCRTILTNVSNIFRDMFGPDGHNIRLIFEGTGNGSDLTVYGNEGRLGQVMTNLIDNALSFSPEGGTVTVRALRRNNKVEIKIEDEGPGIPADKLDAIFKRFYSDRPATDSKRGKNSGLGLSISREIVISHNGEIFAENIPPKLTGGPPAGARFTVRLPATNAPSATPAIRRA
jgi:two-component system, OmpR family, sensor histidine kinase ChvG